MRLLFMVVFQLCVSTWLFAATLHQPKNDYITVVAEQIFTQNPTSGAESLTSGSTMQNFWVYTALPGFTVLKKDVFTALECDIIIRELQYRGQTINNTVLQRYGAFGGITLLRNEKQSGSLLLGSGIATDFSDVSGDIFYFHLIYDHRIRVSDRLLLGMGALISYNMGRFKSPPLNLLPTVIWQPDAAVNVQIAWDNLEVRRLVTERIAAVAEIRYDLSFFHLQEHINYEFETVAIGGGLNLSLGKNWYLRLRYKELVFKDEHIQIKTATIGARHLGIGSGRSIRVLLVSAH